jgi:hypothetical protein
VTSTLGRELVSTQSPQARRKHEENTTDAGRPCHGRPDQRVLSNAAAETGSGSNGGNTTAALHEQAVKFAECMRANGFREFPDPNASGDFV